MYFLAQLISFLNQLIVKEERTENIYFFFIKDTNGCTAVYVNETGMSNILSTLNIKES